MMTEEAGPVEAISSRNKTARSKERKRKKKPELIGK